MTDTPSPTRIEIGSLHFSGLARPAALRAAASFERELARLASAGDTDARAAPRGAVNVRWNADPEKLGRSVAEAVHARIRR